jgi:hypothetical protein
MRVLLFLLNIDVIPHISVFWFVRFIVRSHWFTTCYVLLCSQPTSSPSWRPYDSCQCDWIHQCTLEEWHIQNCVWPFLGRYDCVLVRALVGSARKRGAELECKIWVGTFPWANTIKESMKYIYSDMLVHLVNDANVVTHDKCYMSDMWSIWNTSMACGLFFVWPVN